MRKIRYRVLSMLLAAFLLLPGICSARTYYSPECQLVIDIPAKFRVYDLADNPDMVAYKKDRLEKYRFHAPFGLEAEAAGDKVHISIFDAGTIPSSVSLETLELFALDLKKYAINPVVGESYRSFKSEGDGLLQIFCIDGYKNWSVTDMNANKRNSVRIYSVFAERRHICILFEFMDGQFKANEYSDAIVTTANLIGREINLANGVDYGADYKAISRSSPQA